MATHDKIREMELLAPLPKSSIKTRLNPVINNAISGISVKVFGLPGTGKTSVYNWLANNTSLQKRLEITKDINIRYFDLELTTTKSGNEIVVTEIEKLIHIITSDKQKKLILIFDAAAVLEYNRDLQALLSKYYQNLRPRLSFVFLFSEFHNDADLIKQIPLLKIPLTEISSFFPLFNKEEIERSIEQWQKTLKHDFSSDEKEWLINQSGGYAALNKKLIFLLKDSPKLVKEDDLIGKNITIVEIFDRLSTSFDQSHKKSLYDLVKGNEKITGIEAIVLINFGIVSGEGKLFSPLFEKYLLSKNTDHLQHFGINFSQNLTANELKLLETLHNNKNKIVDRDTMAQAIWGKAWLEKYSDWAIDKTVSQLRLKIAKTEDKKRLKTFRGRGLKFS